MKTVFSLLALVVMTGVAQAGAPPFTNNSPLTTGIDGTYQAVARATNVTGLISFAIQNGEQSNTRSSNNSWVFFVDGNVLNGSTDAVVADGKVDGVLDPIASTSLSGTSNTLQGTTVFVVPGNAAAGVFNGTIDLNSPVAAFSGKGTLTGTPPRTDQIVYILDISNFTTVIGVTASDLVAVVPVSIPGSTFPQTPFKFRGTRLSTTVSTTSGTSTTQ